METPTMGGLTAQGPQACRKMITSLNGKQAHRAAQVTALLLNKCCKQQSLQRPICQHVHAIKGLNYGDDSQKSDHQGEENMLFKQKIALVRDS